MWWIYLCLFITFGFYNAFGQQIFTPKIAFPKLGNSTTQKPDKSSCRCVAIGLCPSNMGLDLRIVNQGTVAPCPMGQTWCCQVTVPLPPCGTSRITNAPAQPPGTARYGAYPWQAAIMSTNNTYLGSGALINANHVLTVAHKVAPYPNFDFKVRLGDWDIQATNEQYPYQDYKPVRVFVHPNYNSQNLFNDIAIIRLNASVPLATSPNINTVCLPSGSPVAGSRCYVAGWGTNAFGSSGMYQRVLKDVDVPIVDQLTCETRLRATRLGAYFNLDRNSFMCAGGETGKDSCTGDGGAPLMCSYAKPGQWTAVGLVTWGIGCANASTPGVYMNIHNYLSWINQTLIST